MIDVPNLFIYALLMPFIIILWLLVYALYKIVVLERT